MATDKKKTNDADYSREKLRHTCSIFGNGIELRWNGARGAIAAYLGDDIVQRWSEEQNSKGKALEEAIAWAKKYKPISPKPDQTPVDKPKE